MTSERQVAAERRARALELRKAGASYEQIAQQCGYSHRGTAHRAVMQALASVADELAADVRDLELTRLDSMLMGLWRAARDGDGSAVDRVLKIMERRAKILGLDSPTDQTAHVVSPLGQVRQRGHASWGQHTA
ncbi:Ni,Fe-hydrogenase III large subunit [Kibdelosporangium banguiense]|uniref:Ni,Fe-hydrogenase III large subunit n=1 Tax=Kibdelosporangium banguiense TaxID=1365924 RepID=A0ABS4TMX7_9PSEU|nr:hypothetical protein [Kibdelosporangium banguiense]MBP2325344.1 Ni,Fe-hydrogenase III large subunit [Kibdelosporangium banguiense]